MEKEQYIEIVEFDENKLKRMSQFIFDPHNHDDEELLIITQGEMEHFIDFQNTIIPAPFISFVNRGKMHRIQFRKDKNGLFPAGWLLRFKNELVIDSKFIIYANYYEYSNVSVHDKLALDRIISVMQLIRDEIAEKEQSATIISSLLKSLFEMVERERQKGANALPKSSLPNNITFKNFLRIVESNFRRDESVEFYATKLNMNVRALNQICQNILQKSVSEIVEIRKLTEAKNLLAKTDKTISEIGYELGYNEKAYFTNVFKKKNGLTPSEFRNKMSNLFA